MNKYRNQKLTHDAGKKGVILLLVVVVLTAIFSISLGVFSVVLNQTTTSQTFESSNIALSAADQSIERTLYRDRQENDFPCPSLPGFPCSTDIPHVTVASGGCMSITTITKAAASPPLPAVTTQITARGLSTACGTVTERTTARAFLTTY